MNFFTLNILIGAMAFTVDRIDSMNKEVDAIESFSTIQETIEKIENEKVKQGLYNFVNGLINVGTTNPILIYIFMFIVYMTPFLNLLILVSSIVDWFRKESD
ncbi:uncharacterized protein CBO05P1_026 [Clostridium botulinum B str. Osaka05]|uniref:Uncharacterized protein n=1 Tax=Clostridium botulinum B str. Osaka05 TaxID=1407017 RepID=A0A060N5D4_CLOBO|nr:hypothetical protein [Clostridium botulinum]BAO04745.1 uncharacterized protein CBO05P1_026 [Clostridium botulinum B str. Osaka05]